MKEYKTLSVSSDWNRKYLSEYIDKRINEMIKKEWEFVQALYVPNSVQLIFCREIKK